MDQKTSCASLPGQRILCKDELLNWRCAA
ncbi:hypothetical protein RSK20926_22064 [Roseobacter sp. SK209-2-6]|nr:hypothetical protein RSK20926_22064 [Roseobacter sp. SK209-2-6]